MPDEDEMQEKLDWLVNVAVTYKKNALSDVRPTCVYTLYSPQGERLAAFAFFRDLLVTGEGMYTVEPGGSKAQ